MDRRYPIHMAVGVVVSRGASAPAPALAAVRGTNTLRGHTRDGPGVRILDRAATGKEVGECAREAEGG
jgi:hypothetical protein